MTMRKGIITLGIIACVMLALLSIGPLAYRFFTDRGLQTADLVNGGEAATVGVDGTWEISPGAGKNSTQAGYTFYEILPTGEKTTSGRTDNSSDKNISGELIVKDETLQEGIVTVQLATLRSDNARRDTNVRQSILHTDKYPEAQFSITKPVNLSAVPGDGTVSKVYVTGDLTIHGKTREITTPLTVLRTGDNVLIEGKVSFKRSDFDVVTGDFVAATIEDEGTLDLLLVFELRH